MKKNLLSHSIFLPIHPPYTLNNTPRHLHPYLFPCKGKASPVTPSTTHKGLFRDKKSSSLPLFLPLSKKWYSIFFLGNSLEALFVMQPFWNRKKKVETSMAPFTDELKKMSDERRKKHT